MFVKNNYNPTTVAMRIKIMLKSNKKTQKELFTALGMAVNTLDNYKKSMPKSDNLAFIADYLDCSVDYLLGRTDNPYISGNYINGDNSVQAVQNSSVTINQGQKEADQENQELLALIQSLPLKKRAKVITFIYDTIESEK